MASARRGTIRLRGGALACAVALLALAGCGGSDSASNGSSSPSAPSISGQPVSQVAVGQRYSFTPTVNNSSGRAVSFSIQNKPAWATFSIATGELTGTPTSAGTYSGVVISVSDGTSSSSLAPFTITVGAAGPGTVSLSWLAPTTNTDGTALTNLAGYIIEYGTNAAELTQTVTLPGPSMTSYTLQGLSSGTWYFAIVAYTTGGSESQLSNVVSTTVT
jgi:Fibronectin type III domain